VVAPIYTRLQATATRLIKQYGRPVNVYHETDAPLPDPTKPWNPGARTFVAYPAQAVIFPVETEFVDDTVLSTDEQCLLSGGGLPDELTPKDYLVDGTDRYQIVKSEPIKPGDLTLVFTLFLRR
jgi:hypothetical protein